MEKQRRKTRVALLSIVSNGSLVILKFIVGLLIGSVSVISEAAHSAVDLFASVIAYISVRKSSTPADESHPYGHGKIENISGTAEALLIFIAAGWIIFEAVGKIINPQPLEAPGWGIAVMLLSVVVNIIVSRSLFRVGKETESVALIADAWHLRTDIYTSAGVMLGLIALWLSSIIWPSADLSLIDPIAALLVAAMIIKAAYDLTLQAGRDLLDTRLPDDEVEAIRRVIEEHRPHVMGYHKLRTRKSGHERFVDFHIHVEDSITIHEAHEICRAISRNIRSRFGDIHVLIHAEPYSIQERETDGSDIIMDSSAEKKTRPAGSIKRAAPNKPKPRGRKIKKT